MRAHTRRPNSDPSHRHQPLVSRSRTNTGGLRKPGRRPSAKRVWQPTAACNCNSFVSKRKSEETSSQHCGTAKAESEELFIVAHSPGGRCSRVIGAVTGRPFTRLWPDRCCRRSIRASRRCRSTSSSSTAAACVARDANAGGWLAGGGSSWRPELLQWRRTCSTGDAPKAFGAVGRPTCSGIRPPCRSNARVQEPGFRVHVMRDG